MRMAVTGLALAALVTGCAHRAPSASPLIVLAPAAVKDALGAAETAISASQPGLAISFHFVPGQPSPADLGTNPPDVIVTSDSAMLDRLVAGGQVTGAQVFAHESGSPGTPLTALHVAIVERSAHRDAAERFTRGLLSLTGQRALRDRGLLSP